MTRAEISSAKRVVVKIGTSSLTHPTGKLDLRRIDKLARVLSDLKNQGREVILVSSGAISAGVERLRLSERPSTISGRQAAACVGQSALIELYNKAFADYGYTVGQMLLTKDVLDKPVLKQNAQNTFNEMLKTGIIPVVNENDSISVDEICFGDNDNLSAYVAILISADLLVLLTDTDGLFDSDPGINANAKLIARVDNPDEDFESRLSGKTSKLGTGGMLSKVTAAKRAAQNGIQVVIANAKNDNILYDILDGKDAGTWFVKR